MDKGLYNNRKKDEIYEIYKILERLNSRDGHKDGMDAWLYCKTVSLAILYIDVDVKNGSSLEWATPEKVKRTFPVSYYSHLLSNVFSIVFLPSP